LIDTIYPFLFQMELEEASIKFTGDGWIITIESARKLTNLICLALLVKKQFNSSIVNLSNLQFSSAWNLRLGIANGQDVKVKFKDTFDYVGDSVRRATRIQSLSNKNEILVDSSVWRDRQRDFEFE